MSDFVWIRCEECEALNLEPIPEVEFDSLLAVHDHPMHVCCLYCGHQFETCLTIIEAMH